MPETRRTVTVLFSDVAGSTSLGERQDPESVRRVMSRYFDAMKAVVETHGGTVEKFIGDAVMAVFGIPRVHEDDALRAVRAAVEMRDRLRDLNDELRAELGVEIAVRTGVHTGEVVAGDPASGQTLVTGDAVNTAARLEQAAASNEILIGEPTYRLVRDAVIAHEVEPLVAKGKADRVHAHRLERVVEGAEAHARRLDAAMVGRADELATIVRAFERIVSERSCRLVNVLGEAGVGKSRLVLEALASIGSGATVLRGRCLPYGEGITFWPVAEVVRQAAGLADDVVPDEARRRIAAALTGVDGADRIADGVAELIGVHEGTRSAEEGFWAIRRFIEGLANDRPVVLVFDDIHWGEETFLDLLHYVVGWTTDAPVLVLCIARPELLDRRPGWTTGPRAESVALGTLEDAECEALLRGLLATPDVPAAVTEAIAGTADGNPLFVEELVAMLIDDGWLVREGDRWSSAPGLAEVAVPPTVQALLTARLEHLDIGERRVLEAASVVGEVFEWNAVTALVPGDLRADLGGSLLSLVRKEIIRPAQSDLSDRDAFRFRHLLIRDAAYAAIAKEARAGLHERFARWLDTEASERLAEIQPIVGYHLEQAFRLGQELGVRSNAGLAREASRHLAAAGRRSLARSDMGAAANLLGRALDLLPQDDRDRPALVLSLVDALREQGRFDLIEPLLDEGARLASAAGDRGLLLRFELRQHYLRLMRDPKQVWLRDVLARAEEIAAEAEALGDPATQGEALLRAARLLGDTGHTAEAGRRLAEAKRIFGRAGIQSAELAFVEAVTFSWQGPNHVNEDITRGERLLAGIEDSTTPVVAYNLLGLSMSQAMIGEIEEARSLFERGSSILRELGMDLELAAAAGITGAFVEMMAGDLVAAEAFVRPAYETLAAMGEKARLSSRTAFLAGVLYEQGRYDEAAEMVDITDHVSAPDDLEPQIWLRGVRAKVLARRGSFEEAIHEARENVRMAEGTDWPGYTGMAWMDLAETLHLAGRDEEAVESARAAGRHLEKKGALIMMERAKSFREAIEAGAQR
jgi:class 3 adenylate cyclase/tetratricopeptide (TPR) repeat protein